MATEQDLKTISRNAGEDLSAKQYYWVKLASDGEVVAAGDGEWALGVVQNKPDTVGQAATVGHSGITKMEAGAAISIDDDIAADANGRGVTATSGEQILARALEAASAAGDIISVFIEKRGKALV